MQKDCVFCKIVKGEIPAQKEAETENLIAFKDINPKAPIHILIVPKKHIKDISEDNGVLWASIGGLAKKIAREKNAKGFRLVHNAGDASLVKHMHVHFLAEVAADREI